MNTPHRCAVCWDWQEHHEDWFAHAVEKHGAVLAEFGYDRCQNKNCPGVAHAKKLPNFGNPKRSGPIGPFGQPVRARDGHVYTPVPLPPMSPS